MSNSNDFIIENSVLKRYVGQDENVVVPEGVTIISKWAFQYKREIKSVSLPTTLIEVGEGAFMQCHSIKEIEIPENVKKLENNVFFECINLESVEIKGIDVAFNASIFSQCANLKKISFVNGFFATQLRRPSLLIPFAPEMNEKDIAYLWMFQDDKWISWLQQQKVDVNIVAKEILDIVLRLEKLTPKLLSRLIDFVDWAYPVINVESVQSFCDAVTEKDVKTAKKFLVAESVQRGLSSERVLETPEPIEEFAISLLENRPLHPNATVFTKGVRYAGKDKICPPQLLNILVSEYLYLYDVYQKTAYGEMNSYVKLEVPMDAIISTKADQIADALDRDELSNVLENMVYSCSKAYRPWMYAYARFATEASAKKLLHHPPSGPSSKVRYWRENLEEAMFFSETKVAVEYLENKERLEKYARIRGMSIQEFRDKFSLPKWDINEKGIIKSAFGRLGYVLTSEFVLRPVELETGKELRSVSAKTNPDAANEFKELKKEVASFYKKRAEYIRTIYITAEHIDVQHWLATYCNNPILRPVTQKVIWTDAAGEIFMLDKERILTISGEEYDPKEWVAIAHVLEMSKEQICEWQSELVKKDKKLLIEQVWESIATISDVDVFEKIVLSPEERNEFKRILGRKGITVKSENDYSEFNHRANRYIFSDTGTMFVGKSLEIRYRVDENNGETTLLSFKCKMDNMTRELNAILLELGRVSAKSLIRKDGVEQLSILLTEHFTIAQIMEFINIARESGSGMAILLDYKNRMFNDFDPMEEFTLDL